MKTNLVILFASILFLSGCSEPAPEPVKSSMKLTLSKSANYTLTVKNTGSNPIKVYKPFLNSTKLIMLNEIDKESVYSKEATEGIDLYVTADAGASVDLPFELNQYSDLNLDGQKKIKVRIQGFESNVLNL